MQFSCKVCGELFKLREGSNGHLACLCGLMTPKQDHDICRFWLAHFAGIDIGEYKEKERR